jgi:hypothetical protein
MKMKSDFPNNAVRTCVSALLLALAPCFGQTENTAKAEVAVAALSLPEGSGGLLHWRVGAAASTPLQLSTRYFSDRLEAPTGTIGFYDHPVAEAADPPPEPLLALKIPQDANLVFIVLWSELDDDGEPRWRGNLIRGSDWEAGSLRLFNSTSEPLGILAADEPIRLAGGKSVDFHARDRPEAFAVKIYRLKPERRAVFSSKWRVTAGRRELCFLVDRNNSLSFRSLLDLAASPAEATP